MLMAHVFGIRGTMITAPPIWSDFAATGNSSAQRAQDATYNINMLRGKYGTEIKLVSGTAYGVLENSGPGHPICGLADNRPSIAAARE